MARSRLLDIAKQRRREYAIAADEAAQAMRETADPMLKENWARVEAAYRALIAELEEK